jgi:hypothetical protein
MWRLLHGLSRKLPYSSVRGHMRRYGRLSWYGNRKGQFCCGDHLVGLHYIKEGTGRAIDLLCVRRIDGCCVLGILNIAVYCVLWLVAACHTTGWLQHRRFTDSTDAFGPRSNYHISPCAFETLLLHYSQHMPYRYNLKLRTTARLFLEAQPLPFLVGHPLVVCAARMFCCSWSESPMLLV